MLKRNYFQVEKQSSFFEEIVLCKEKLQAEYSLQAMVGITLFVNASGEADFFEKRLSIKTLFNEHFPYLPLSVISQPAGEGIAVEIWTCNSCKNIIYKKECGLNYTVFDNSWGKFIWGAGLSTDNPALSHREQASFSFERMQAILSKEGFTMDHLIRQWNYIPGILKTTIENDRLYQHYQSFNDIRQSYYRTYKQNEIYPAATGIGMDWGAVTIDFLAVRKKDTTLITGLNNPKQTNAYNYGQEVLVGSPLKENETKQAPLFERAKYIGSADRALVFISGTASIIGEKTLGLDNLSEQTTITIDNISQLTSKENLASAGISPQKKNYTYLRVYIKKNSRTNQSYSIEKEINTVRKICEGQYGGIPILYVIADICRDNLLVEIEGEAEIFVPL
jgi:enamine deaminase RidA (YjgF/YER057c/UK114 family)